MNDPPVVAEGLIALTNLHGGDLERQKVLLRHGVDGLIMNALAVIQLLCLCYV